MEALLKLIALFLALFFAFMAVLRWYANVKGRRMQGKSFEGLQRGVVYFYSERCGACKLMKPEVEKLRQKVHVMEVDVAKPEGYRLARELGVMATPTSLVVRDGVIKKVFVGVVKADRLLQELES